MNSETKTCQNCKNNFTIEPDEFAFYEKVGILPATQCLSCRTKHHLSFWLFGKFRKGVSDLSGDSIITILPEKNRYPIYSLKEWHSDNWNAMDYGQEYDNSKSLFEQLKNLQEKIPRPHQTGSNNTDCDWSDDAWNCKNCYLSRSMDTCEDLFYAYHNRYVKNSIDPYVCFNSDRLYECFYCFNSYKIFYSRDSRDCLDSYFLFDCRNCTNCFMCWNLRSKSYCIENMQYTKQEYQEKIKSFNLGSYASITSFKNNFKEIVRSRVVHRENFNFKAYNSTGNYLSSTTNCINCFNADNSQDSFNCVSAVENKSLIDCSGCFKAELCGNCSCCVEGYDLRYSSWSSSRYSEYLDICIECEYCFACVGLKKKKNCILNKQYTKEEYNALKNKIVSDMKMRDEYGKFLPYSMSLGPYNLSTGFLYFPDTKEEHILSLGGYWENLKENHVDGIETKDLPDNIQDVEENITKQSLICPETGWRFNIAPNELLFYKQNNIPLPRQHFDVRIKSYINKFIILEQYPYSCVYCSKNIMTHYPPEWGYQKIACIECYQNNLN
jgi:phage pi2 protein 07